ncbi:MAG: NADH-quinone oxidoreductase subunit C [Anaerolineales bacterium]
MTTNEALLLASRLLKPTGGTESRPEANRLDLSLPVDKLLEAAAALRAAQWGYLAAITGLDGGAPAGELEVLYHFCEGAAVVTLRVSVPRTQPIVPSLAALAPSAGLYERELSEMLGVTVSDSPNTDRLYLPDDWPADVYPLRKDAVLASPSGHIG